jgi:hypothetical protein
MPYLGSHGSFLELAGMRESAKALNKGLDMLETLASERRELMAEAMIC